MTAFPPVLWAFYDLKIDAICSYSTLQLFPVLRSNCTKTVNVAFKCYLNICKGTVYSAKMLIMFPPSFKNSLCREHPAVPQTCNSGRTFGQDKQ